MPEYSNAMFAHAWSIVVQSLQRRSKHASSGDPFQHSLEEGGQKNLFQGSQTTMEDQTCFVSLENHLDWQVERTLWVDSTGSFSMNRSMLDSTRIPVLVWNLGLGV